MGTTNTLYLPHRINIAMRLNFNTIFYVQYRSEEISPNEIVKSGSNILQHQDNLCIGKPQENISLNTASHGLHGHHGYRGNAKGMTLFEVCPVNLKAIPEIVYGSILSFNWLSDSEVQLLRAANPNHISVTTFWFMERMAIRMMLLKTRVRMEMVESTRILVHCKGCLSGQQG